ncbi:MAG: hypothetical protein WBN53_05165 [Thermodesulfobacteriota bacterium]
MEFHEPTNRILYGPASFAKRVILLYRSLRLRQVEIEDSLSGERLTYIGEGETLDYVRRTLFTNVKEIKATPVPIWLLPQRIKHLISLNIKVIVEINRMLAPLVPAGGLVTFPWIRQRVSLNSGNHTEKRRNIEATFGRKVRKFDYRCQMTRDQKMVRKFYEDLYLPYLTTRFESACHARTLSELQTAIRSGFLLQVFAQDRWVSGVVCRLEKDKICTLAFGHLPGNQYDLRRGALSAAYYFIFKWAEEHSMQNVDLLRSRPNTSDGVYEHKRRWGAKPVIDSWPHTALWIFLPKTEICPRLKTQLIWKKDEFVEIQRLSFGLKTEQEGNRMMIP